MQKVVNVRVEIDYYPLTLTVLIKIHRLECDDEKYGSQPVASIATMTNF